MNNYAEIYIAAAMPQHRALTRRYEPRGDSNHPLSPDYDDSAELEREWIEAEIWERSDDVAGITMSDDRASTALELVLWELLHDRQPSECLLRELKDAVCEAVRAEAAERQQRRWAQAAEGEL